MSSGISGQSPTNFEVDAFGDSSSPTGHAERQSPFLGILSSATSTSVSKPIPRVISQLLNKNTSEFEPVKNTQDESAARVRAVMDQILQQAGIKSKISFGENLAVKVEEFEITSFEYWSMFPICCPNYSDVRCFQEIGSLKAAHDFLASLYNDPCVSKFIPQNSIREILGTQSEEELNTSLACLHEYERSGQMLGDVPKEEADELLEELREDAYKTLGTLYEVIKLADRSEKLNKFCRSYLYSIKDTPEFYEAAVILLRDKLDSEESDQTIFLQEYEKAQKGEELDSFVYSLSKLIPLDVFARLRLDEELLYILENQPNYTVEKVQIKEVRKIAKKITDLDLSEVSLRVVPPELSKVVKCNLGNNYSNIPDCVFIQLPKLTYLTLSFDQSDEDFADDLLRSLELIPNLEELDLSAASVELEDLPEIITYAIEKKISIVLPMPEKERDLIALMDSLGLQFPAIPPSVENRYFRGTEESLKGLEELNTKSYQSLLTNLKSPANVKILSELTELDLSNVSIGTLPEDISELTGLVSVVLGEINVPEFKMMDMIGTIVTLPNLKTLTFLDSRVEKIFPNLRSICETNAIELVIEG